MGGRPISRPHRLDRIPELALIPGLAPPRPFLRAGAAAAFSPRLVHAMGHFRIHPLTFGNRVTLYRYGRDALNAMLESIESARDHVNLESYIFEADRTGQKFADALARAAGRGAVVNLTVDAVGCWGTPDEFFEDLQERGVRVLLFHPVRPWRVRHGRWILNRRNHRKILVVDGRVGFTGGLNIGDSYDDLGGTPGRWKDMHQRIDGPAVKYLQRVFMGCRWREEGDRVPEADYFPALEEVGDQAVRVLPTNPVIGRPYARLAFRRAIHAAELTVHATQAYFMPDARVLWSLRAASRRGVEVALVTPSVSDIPLALHAGRSTYGRLLRSGVQIREYQLQVLHQKTVVVDGEWSILGSANMDTRSFRINHEISVEVLGRDLGERLEEAYRDDAEHSIPVTLEEWARRPLLVKLHQRFCGFLRAFV